MVPMALESAQPVLFPFGSTQADETECILFFFEADWSMHLSHEGKRSLSFGNHSDSSGDDAVSETTENVMPAEFVYDKLRQGDYNKKVFGIIPPKDNLYALQRSD